MIEIQTKIHDKFSIEFKIRFSGRDEVKMDYFDVNSWIFIPNGLYINKNTYSKERFYTDIKSNIRLVTPTFTLRQMVEGENSPITQLKKSLNDSDEYNFQIKLFGSIFKSSIRDESADIVKHKNDDGLLERCTNYVADVKHVLQSYRDLANEIGQNDEMLTKYAFTDEFMSHQVEIRTMKIIKVIQDLAWMRDAYDSMAKLLKEETDYKIAKGYSHVIFGDDVNNRNLVLRHSLLKKYVESALFLRSNTTEDGRAVKQISFSLAAGLAMMISLLVTMPFQKYLGNYPSLIFIILILIYMVKDRVKDLTRWLFAYQLKDKYYDNKTIISIKNKKIGAIKEGMDFITDDKIPDEVLKLRGRNILEIDNNLLDEKIVLYRKRVEIDNKKLKNQYTYAFNGINDIIRYHINYISKKMDNPETGIDCLDDQNQVQRVMTERIYVLHFVIQFKWEELVEYKVFHVTVNRNGILDIS